jgi:hypothetical protein
MRLLKSEQEMLLKKVEETVFGDREKKAHDEYILECQTKIASALKEKYPAKDMAVLQKYGFTRVTSRIALRRARYEYFDFDLPKETLLPENACYEDAQMYDKIKLVRDNLKRANSTAREPYVKLIRGSTTWEQVIEVWPEAKKYQPVKGCVALIAVSPEVRGQVRRDSKTREWK